MHDWSWFIRIALGTILCAIVFTCRLDSVNADTHPNIVLIYADDLGYGDVSCYGATRVKTPQIDRLAEQGLRFTDGHSSAATCTPSRYAMLTGEYAWRKKGTGVLPGEAAMIIQPGRQTLASILKSAGYRTGVVGKWHLGLGNGNLNWNGEIKPGPLEIGFDSCFLMPATGDRVPCVYVNDHHVVGLDPKDPLAVRFGKPLGSEPTGKDHPELLTMKPSHGHDQTIIDGVSRIGYMTGGVAARWKDAEMADTFVARARTFLQLQARSNSKSPFFLYFSTHDVHVPRVPHPRFLGKSGMGPRGDAILEFDWSVGEILKTLDDLQLAENTLVILTSDNGPVVDDGYQDEAVAKLNGHLPAGHLRGGKYSNYEGGTRVPFIVRWPARVKPGVSDALVCQVDFSATFAALTGQTFSDTTAPDGRNVLPALLGESPQGREHLIEQAGSISIRHGTWKLIEQGNGARRNTLTNTDLGNSKEFQLFNLQNDIGETKNLAEAFPERVRAMAQKLADIRDDGRQAK